MRLRAALVAVVAAFALTACGQETVTSTSTAPSSSADWVTDGRVTTASGAECTTITEHGADLLLADGQQPAGPWFAARWSSTDPTQLVVGGQVVGHDELALFTVWDASADLSPTAYELEIAHTLNSLADSVSAGQNAEPARAKYTPGQLDAIYRNGLATITGCRTG